MATDDFERADEDPIASPWVKIATDAGKLVITSGSVLGWDTSTNHTYYYSSITPTAAQYAEVTMGTPTSSAKSIGSGVRLQTGAWSGYVSEVKTGATAIVRLDAGVRTVLDSESASTNTTGDVFRLEISSGNQLTLKKNGSILLGPTAADTTFASGRVGMDSTGDGSERRISAWAGGDLAAEGPDPIPLFVQGPSILMVRRHIPGF